MWVSALIACLFFCFGCGRGDVLISQVVEGSSFNKAVVVANRGANAANLSEYGLQISFNDKPWQRVREPLSDEVLEAGDTFVLCHGRFEESFSDLCDAFDNSISLNGNDAIALLRGSTQVDVFGVEKGVGLSGAGGYTIQGVKEATKDHTLLRMPEITQGETVWDVAVEQWLVLPVDVFVKQDGTRVTLVRAAPPQEVPETPAPVPETSAPVPDTPAQAPETSEPVWLKKPVHTRRQHLAGSGRRTVRLGTFNVEFLFDGVDDPRISPFAGKPEEAEKHFIRVRDYIRSLDVDFLTLCEVEDKKIVDRLAEEVGGVEGHFVQGTDTFTGQDVALLSKLGPKEMYRSSERVDFPLPDSTCGFGGTGNTGVSKHYVAKFDTSSYFPFKFAMVGMHLKAIPNEPRSCAKREGQAEVIRRIVAELIGDGYEVMVMGDINDFSDKTQDIQNDKPNSSVLSMLRNPFMPADGKDELWNTMELIPKAGRYSAWWDRNRDGRVNGIQELSQIDHILLTRGLWDLVDRAWVDHAAPPGVVSDHWPVMVEFVVGKTDSNLKCMEA